MPEGYKKSHGKVKMKFSNRKGKTVSINLSANSEFKEPIWAKIGFSQSFKSTSTDLKNLSNDDAKAVLSNANQRIILK